MQGVKHSQALQIGPNPPCSACSSSSSLHAAFSTCQPPGLTQGVHYSWYVSWTWHFQALQGVSQGHHEQPALWTTCGEWTPGQCVLPMTCRARLAACAASNVAGRGHMSEAVRHWLALHAGSGSGGVPNGEYVPFWFPVMHAMHVVGPAPRAACAGPRACWGWHTILRDSVGHMLLQCIGWTWCCTQYRAWAVCSIPD